MKDKRYLEIKKILKQVYPKAIFKIKIDKYSLGQTINIYTDLIKDYTEEESNVLWLYNTNQLTEVSPVFKSALSKKENNEEITQGIEKLLSGYWHIDKCSITGEILSGGNKYLFIKSIERK